MRLDAHESSAASWLQRPGRLLAVGLLLVLVTGASTWVLTLSLQGAGLRASFRQLAEERGFDAFGHGESLSRALIALPGRAAGSALPPALVLDVPFEHMRKLYAQREEALARGQLVQGSDDFVPAKLRHEGRTIKVKIRLKGDRVEHFEGDKWSFRVHVKGDDHVFGMRRFSLQHPKVRFFQSELLERETMRREGVLVPRIRFVDLTVNGNPIGVMALEEHFSKELLESNRRRDSVVLKFDESLLWLASDGIQGSGFAGAFDSFRNAPVAAFGRARIDRSPLLSSYLAAATGLLQGFAGGRLAASEVFDVERLGRYLAVCQLWGAWHGVRWHNQRFAYDPYAARLEPIAFDASVKQPPSHAGQVIDSEPIVEAMLADAAVREAYRRALRRLIEDTRSGVLPSALRAAEAVALPLLRAEFPFLPEYPIAQLEARAERLAELTDAELSGPSRPEALYPVLVHARIARDSETESLEIANAVPHEVVIQDIRFQGGASPPLSGSSKLPIRLPPTPSGTVPEIQSHPLARPAGAAEATIELRVGLRDQLATRLVEVPFGSPASSLHPIPQGDLSAQLDLHSFLTRGEEPDVLRIQAGTHDVRGTLVVPPGHRLTAGPATTLRFEPEGMLISHGPLDFRGAEGREIVLEARSPAEGWLGIAVIDAGEVSTWEHVWVRNPVEVARGNWKLTGGVNFLRSDLTARHVRVEGSRGEDALNIVGAHFQLEDLWIQHTRSDAFDADFSTGKVTGGGYRDVGLAGGGDAIDVSGSEIEVEGTSFERVGDKGLSVGEGSRMRARGVVMNDVGAGAVVKDGSALELVASEIRDARVAALMAYVKKPEYGPGTLEARDVELIGEGAEPRVQTGSVLTVDGTEVATEPLDVDALYDSAMKKAVAR